MNTGTHLNNRIFITGGTGTLGRAVAQRARSENWSSTITVYSRDPIKQLSMKRNYPEIHFIQGDIRDYDNLYRAMVGHEVVIHAAAQKHIPAGEANVSDTVTINVDGSRNVALAALQANVKQVVGISTDKVCHPVNVYGCTKALMEAIFLEFNRYGLTKFHLCRYGNVIGSAGSVLTVWEKQAATDKLITITDPTMTRFWMTEDHAVDTVMLSLTNEPGMVLIPKLIAASMERFAKCFGHTAYEVIGRRPGEKQHEVLLTSEEWRRAIESERHFLLTPNEQRPSDEQVHEYSSCDVQTTCTEIQNMILGAQA